MACLSLAFNIKKHQDKTITAELERVEKEILDKGSAFGIERGWETCWFAVFLGGQRNQQKSVETDDFEQKSSLKFLEFWKKGTWKSWIINLIWQNCQKLPVARVAQDLHLHIHSDFWSPEKKLGTQCFPVFSRGQFWFKNWRFTKALRKINLYFDSSVMFSHCERGTVNVNCWSDPMKTDSCLTWMHL